jgi:hypothetical protein
MISLGAHPKLVIERLGHSDISITMCVYGHVFETLHEHVTDQPDALYRQTVKDARNARRSRSEAREQ